MAIVIISTHSYMADGVKQTVEYIMGKQNNLFSVSAYVEGASSFLLSVEEIITKYPSEDIFLLTDILGGSVNNELNTLQSKFSNIHLITGVNLPMVIQLLLPHKNPAKTLSMEAVKEAKKSIVYMNEKKIENKSFDDF